MLPHDFHGTSANDYQMRTTTAVDRNLPENFLTSHPRHTPIWAVSPDQEQSLDADGVLTRGVCLQSPNNTYNIYHSEVPMHIQGRDLSDREPTTAVPTERLSLRQGFK